MSTRSQVAQQLAEHLVDDFHDMVIDADWMRDDPTYHIDPERVKLGDDGDVVLTTFGGDRFVVRVEALSNEPAPIYGDT